MPEPDWVFVGLGGNIGSQVGSRPVRRRRRAPPHLAQPELSRASPSFAPRRPARRRQPEFLNQVAGFPPGPGLEPRGLLELLLAIEAHHGRVRMYRRARARSTSNLLLFGAARIVEPGLVVPHPRIGPRAFVLAPLLELLVGRAASTADLKQDCSTHSTVHVAHSYSSACTESRARDTRRSTSTRTWTSTST